MTHPITEADLTAPHHAIRWRASYGEHGVGGFAVEGGERGFSTLKASRVAQTVVAAEREACGLPEVGGA